MSGIKDRVRAVAAVRAMESEAGAIARAGAFTPAVGGAAEAAEDVLEDGDAAEPVDAAEDMPDGDEGTIMKVSALSAGIRCQSR